MVGLHCTLVLRAPIYLPSPEAPVGHSLLISTNSRVMRAQQGIPLQRNDDHISEFHFSCLMYLVLRWMHLTIGLCVCLEVHNDCTSLMNIDFCRELYKFFWIEISVRMNFLLPCSCLQLEVSWINSLRCCHFMWFNISELGHIHSDVFAENKYWLLLLLYRQLSNSASAAHLLFLLPKLKVSFAKWTAILRTRCHFWIGISRSSVWTVGWLIL
jgi:hypothetical protein